MQSKTDFYNAVYSTAKQLGATDVQAHLAASQASLETGYGRNVVGNNYFGIKASPSWSGDSVAAATKEDTAGGMVGITDSFRAYGGLAESVANYMDVMSRNFADAWNAPTLSDAISNLSEGKFGAYATDRKYESKITNIANRFSDTVGAWFDNVPTPTPGPNTDAETAAMMQPAPGLLASAANTVGDTAGRLSRGILGFANNAVDTAAGIVPAFAKPSDSFPAAPAMDAANSGFAQGMAAQRDYSIPASAMASQQPASNIAQGILAQRDYAPQSDLASVPSFGRTIGVDQSAEQQRGAEMQDRLSGYNAMPKQQDAAGILPSLMGQPTVARADPFASVMPGQTNIATQQNVVSAYESNPATPTNADPLQAAAQGPYTSGNLTNSIATSPATLGVPAEAVPSVSMPAAPVASSFQPNGFQTGVAAQTLGDYNTNPLGTQYAQIDPAKVTNVTPGILAQPSVQVQPAVQQPVSTQAVVAPQVQHVQEKAKEQTKLDGILSKIGTNKTGVVGGILGGATLGPLGGLIGGLLGKYIGNNPDFANSFNSPSFSVNNIGGGSNAVYSVYGGAPYGTQANTNNGGTVTSLPTGTAYTNPYGVTTVTDANGHQSSYFGSRL